MARAPEATRIYAIGDIHGCAGLLSRLFEKIEREEKLRGVAASHLVFLGDYIDRGPASPAVIELLLHGLPGGLNADFLMGNHEQMLLDALDSETALPLWLSNGGGAVLEAYTDAARLKGAPPGHWTSLAAILPDEHLNFFRSLALTAQYGDYLFAHAGVRPGVALDRQDPSDLVWIRRPFLDHTGDFGKIIVHGHTPVDAPEIHPNRIAIDTGAVFTGRLTALVLEGDRQDFLST